MPVRAGARPGPSTQSPGARLPAQRSLEGPRRKWESLAPGEHPLKAPRSHSPDSFAFGPGPIEAPPARLAASALAPAGLGRPLPGRVRRPMERAFGVDLGAVRVHEDRRPDAVGALAYTRGNHLHFSPGWFQPDDRVGRVLLGHELAHVVQQRAGRVRKPAGGPVNADRALEAEAERMGDQAARGERAAPRGWTVPAAMPASAAPPGGGVASATQPAQPGLGDWLMRKFGFGDIAGQRRPLLSQSSAEPSRQERSSSVSDASALGSEPRDEERGPVEPMQLGADQALAANSLQSSSAEKAGLGLGAASSAASGLGTPLGAFGQLTASSGASGLADAFASAGSGLSAAGSLVDAGIGIHRIRTGAESDADKRLMKMQVASSLGSVATSAASAAKGAYEYGGQHVPGAVAAAAGPFAMVTGAADLTRGVVGGVAAHRRQRALEGMAAAPGTTPQVQALASYAADAQKAKNVGSVGTALKGGLGMAGGIALLAGSGPVGWGLLGGAALVGGGVAAYKAYRRHSQGNDLRQGKGPLAAQLQTLGVQTPTDRELAAQPWYTRWTASKGMRTHDIVRGRVAAVLRGHDRNVVRSPEILRLLGLKPNADERQIARALEA